MGHVQVPWCYQICSLPKTFWQHHQFLWWYDWAMQPEEICEKNRMQHSEVSQANRPYLRCWAIHT